MKLNSFFTDPVPKGKRIVAFSNDGSCARLFYVRKNGVVLTVDGEIIQDAKADDYFCESGFVLWAELPEDYKLWFERIKLGC